MASEELMQKMQEQIIKLDGQVDSMRTTVENISKEMLIMQKQINDLDRSMLLQANKIDGSLKRIDDQSKLAGTVQDLASDIKVLITEQKTTDKKIDKLTTDVDELKQEPANKWKDTIKVVVSVVVTAVVTYVLVRLGLK